MRRKFELWDSVICLCLDKRKEYWKDLQKQTESLGIEFIPFIVGKGQDSTLKYDLIDEPNPDVRNWGYGSDGLKQNHYWALKSHQKMAAKAQELGFKRVLFMEDDAYWTSRALTIIENIEKRENFLDYLLSFPVIYAGWWGFGEENSEYNLEIENSFNESGEISLREIKYGTNIGGAHGIIFTKEMFPIIQSLPPITTLDTQLCFLRGKIPAVKICPKIIHVKSCWSYCEGAVFNRKIL